MRIISVFTLEVFEKFTHRMVVEESIFTFCKTGLFFVGTNPPVSQFIFSGRETVNGFAKKPDGGNSVSVSGLDAESCLDGSVVSASSSGAYMLTGTPNSSTYSLLLHANRSIVAVMARRRIIRFKVIVCVKIIFWREGIFALKQQKSRFRAETGFLVDDAGVEPATR